MSAGPIVTVAAAISTLALGVSIEFGPGLVAVMTMIAATTVQLTVAILAFLTARTGKRLAVEANAKADEAAITNNLTHDIVNSRSTAMEKSIADRDAKIVEQERHFKEKIRDLEGQMAKLNETVTVERARGSKSEKLPKPPTT